MKYLLLVLLSSSLIQAMDKASAYDQKYIICDGSLSPEETEVKKSVADLKTTSNRASIGYNEIEHQNLIKSEHLAQKLLNAITTKNLAETQEILTHVQNEESFTNDNRNAVFSLALVKRIKQIEKQFYIDTLARALEKKDLNQLLQAYQLIRINHPTVDGSKTRFSEEEQCEIFSKAFTKLSLNEDRPKYNKHRHKKHAHK